MLLGGLRLVLGHLFDPSIEFAVSTSFSVMRQIENMRQFENMVR